MVTMHPDDGGDPILFLGSDDATFEIVTWCSDDAGQVPEQVHLVIELAPEVRILYRFTGPEALTRLIDALALHRRDVWPDHGGSA